MSNDLNAHTVLGTLVDRAVCMPYAKPQVLRRGQRRAKATDQWTTEATIREDIASAASFLANAVSSADAHSDWSTAQLAADPAGPWWPKPRDDFFELDHSDRQWVLDRLAPIADELAGCLENQAVKRDWTWLWSQPSFASPGRLRPSITRPDLVAGLDWRRCDIVDVKTTSRMNLADAIKPSVIKKMHSWAASLTNLRFVPQDLWALVTSTTEAESEWISIDPSRSAHTD